MLRVCLFGGVEIDVDGRALNGLSGTRAGFLLGYLMLERQQRHARGDLAGLLWPEAVPSVARANLRQLVHQLRGRLEAVGVADLLLSDRQSLRARLDDDDEIDVEAVGESLCCGGAASDATCRAGRAELARGIAQYRGPLFGREVDASLGERARAWLERRRGQADQALHARIDRLAACCRTAGDHDTALAALRGYLRVAPDDQHAQRTLMELLAESGQPRTAIAEYDTFAAQLGRDQGRAPDDATVALRERIAAHGSERGDRIADDGLPVEHRVVTVAALLLGPPRGQAIEHRLAAMGQARERARERLAHHRGHVIDAHGGLLFAYFGYPAPVERSAPRAAVALREAVSSVGPGVTARAAIHADWTLTGSDPDLPDPAGEVSSVVARLAERAASGEVLVTDALHARFDFDQPVGRAPETDEPVPAYRLLLPDRPDCAPAAETGPLVAREREYRALARAWRDAHEGRACCAFVRGVAGIGKTRLLEAVLSTAAKDGGRVLTLRAMPHARERPLGAVSDSLNAWLAAGDLDSGGRAARLASWLDSNRGDVDASLAALARIVDLPDAGPPLEEPDPGRVRRAILDALDHLLASVIDGPFVLAVEDVHWLDAATQAWLWRLPCWLAGQPVLMLASGRPEAECPWPDTDTTVVELEALDSGDAARLLDAAAAGPIDADRQERILERAGGVPLFIEELARVSAADLDAAHAAPSPLQDLVLARLERAGDVRSIAELCAVAGESFADRVIDGARGPHDPAAGATLERLVELGLIVRERRGESGCHAWRHALYRDAVRSALPAARARTLHDRLADVLIATDAAPETIAAQLEAAGRQEEAIPHLLRAGERTLLAGFASAAARHFRKALASIPVNRRWASTLIDARIGLGTAHLVADGYGSRAVDEALRGALAVPGLRADPERYGRLLSGLLGCASSHHGYGEARRLTIELDRLAEETGDPVLAVGVRTGEAVNELFTGTVPAAIERASRARMLGRDCATASLVARFGDNPALTGAAVEGWAHCLAARQDAARDRVDTAVREADATGHAPSILAVHGVALIAAQRADDTARVSGFLERVDALTRDGDFAFWRAVADALSLWLQSRRDGACAPSAVTAVAARIEEAMAGTASVFRLVLGDALWCAGHLDAAWRMSDEALRGIERVGDTAILPEVHLQRARLRAIAGANDDARAELDRAAEGAERRAAPLIALEAAAARSALTGVPPHTNPATWPRSPYLRGLKF
jgi:DNA-binding SARP family transcriptional activator